MSSAVQLPLGSVVCAGCPVLCDDVRLTEDGVRVVPAADECPRGREFLSNLGPLTVRAFAKGRPVTVPEALAAAATLLAAAEAPAVVGLTGLTVEALREVVPLAEMLGAVLAAWPPDPSRTWGHHAPDLTRTWGEVRNHSDLIIFWRCDPDRIHPRFVSRVLGTKAGRLVLLVDERLGDNITDEHTANYAVAFPPADDLAFVQRLRLHFERGEPVSGDAAVVAGLLAKARHAHVFVDPATAANPVLIGQMQLLAAKLHGKVRMGVSVLPTVVNGRAASEVLAWQTGFPGPVGFASGAPAYRPGIWEADRLLADGMADVVMCAGLDVESLGAEGRVGLSRKRRIVIGPREDSDADVSFTVPGLDPRLDAHVVRPDGIMLRLCGENPGTPDPAAELLRQLRGACA